jgi:undecaprenyl-diphosphatase
VNPLVTSRWPTRWWIAAGGLLVVLLLSFQFDAALDRWVAVNRAFVWETAAKICSRYFAWHYLMLYALIGLSLAWWRGRQDWMRILCVMMLSASLAGLSADFLRAAIGRTRPSAKVAQGWYGVRSGSEWLITEHAYNSFPSGHTTAATGFALPLLFWRRRCGWLVLPFIGAVAAARIYVGAHHLTDVIAGALLGFLIALWIWRRTAAGEDPLRVLPQRWRRTEA